jgi:hypothetical protein
MAGAKQSCSGVPVACSVILGFSPGFRSVLVERGWRVRMYILLGFLGVHSSGNHDGAEAITEL